MVVAQDHKDRAADLQKQLDDALKGIPPSADREKLMNQMQQQMSIASEYKDKAADL